MPWSERRARMRPRPFDLDPLARVVGVRLGVAGGPDDHALTLTALAERLGVGYTHVKRMRQLGLSPSQADRFAIALELHPAIVWPLWCSDAEPGPPPAPPWMVGP